MLTVTDDLCLHHEAVQPDKRGRARAFTTTVAHVGGPPVCRCRYPQNGETSDSRGGP